ncbi:aldo/keto reductase [Pseudochrobactrum sp. sp1633]|uniref:aldo/keto reductase n=1 Tax=Pseudochrobactrum sp. sp1633 TaxID=3036706 RepID=UPI0025A63DAF|nr:aldo/keto reductase [Pseudochrobactrum sp. sp1633]MDM8345735.1 aldo/keto reductase [Pseudochrobactrum sp. sp1633]HWD12439.1 aldo/keto reductase [Pseudochrobactrum sp.]
MHLKQLGRSDLTVSPLCFGGNVFGWTADETTSFALLDRLLDAELTFIDTANIYSRWVPGHQGGESEAVIGNWLKSRGNREKLTIATKVGGDMGEGFTMAPAHIRECVDASLKRLQTDYIDLYQSHYDDPNTPFEDVLGTFQDLIKAGKVRAIGASNITGERLKTALETSEKHNLPRYDSLQPLYNLYDRSDYETTLEPVVSANQVGVIPYYALAAGFLTGKYRSEADLSISTRGNRVGASYLNERGLKILEAMDQVAERYAVKPAQIAIAWLMAQPSITAPIASATKIEQLDELIKATRLTLDQDALDTLNKASA